MRNLTEEDIAFLQNLQTEMLTQDNVGQADPRFWAVRGVTREYGIEEGYDDGTVLLNYSYDVLAEDMEELYYYITEETNIPDYYDIEYSKVDDVIIMNSEEESFCIYDICDFVDYFGEELDVYVCRYKEVDKIFENTMFLTKRECEEHIKLNYYHYPKDAHSYAMTAWRSPQVEKLYEILQEVDWNNLSVNQD